MQPSAFTADLQTLPSYQIKSWQTHQSLAGLELTGWVLCRENSEGEVRVKGVGTWDGQWFSELDE